METTTEPDTLESVAEEHNLSEEAFRAYCDNMHIRENYADSAEDTHRHREEKEERDRRAGRHAGRQTGGQTDTHTDRQTNTRNTDRQIAPANTTNTNISYQYLY